jgi:plasmid stability protein
MRAITIKLPDDLDRQLREQSDRRHQTPEDTAREILHRRLTMDRFHELCRESEALAKAAGFASEDDVLRAIS